MFLVLALGFIKSNRTFHYTGVKLGSLGDTCTCWHLTPKLRFHWSAGEFSHQISGGSRISRMGAWTPEVVTFQKFCMSKRKNLDPWEGVGAGHAPSRSANANVGVLSYLAFSLKLAWFFFQENHVTTIKTAHILCNSLAEFYPLTF